jgi:hypothetical protein
LLVASSLAGLLAQYSENVLAFVLIAMFQAGVWIIAAALITHRLYQRWALALILGTAILLRLIALAAPVFLSDDINRYIWDGRVQAAGINPYRYIPTDPELAPLRDEAVFRNINRSNYAPTIYPPVAQMLFFLANRFGGRVLAVKLLFIGVEAAGIVVLLTILRAVEKPRVHILFYVWHPLPVWEIAGSGHVDAAVVTFVTLALVAAVTGRRASSGAVLAAATLVKFVPLVLAPALWRPRGSNRGDWQWLAAFIVVIIAAYSPYIGVGARVIGFLPGYLTEENLASGSGFCVLDMARHVSAVPLAAYLGVATTVMAGLAIAALFRPSNTASSLTWAMLLATAALFFISPHYPWYFVWLVALLTASPWWPAWWLTLIAPLLYWNAKTGLIPGWTGFTVYGGFAILAGVDLLWRSLFAVRPGAEHGTDRPV